MGIKTKALPTYKSVDEKKKYFKYKQINTPEEFEDVFEKMVNMYTPLTDTPKSLSDYLSPENMPFIFRGVKDARYKLYTSAQRKWIEEEWKNRDIPSFDVFVDMLLKQVKQWQYQDEAPDLIRKYYSTFNADLTDPSLLSFFQHYRAPTPLIDFTYNKRVALYFATKDIEVNNDEGDLGNYFSIYLFPQQRIRSIEDLILSRKEVAKDPKLVEIFKCSDNVSSRDVVWNDAHTHDERVFKLSNKNLLFIPNPLYTKYIGEKRPLYWPNLNILAQKGCFILNSDGERSLEEMMRWFRQLHEATAPDPDMTITCFDIHKSIAMDPVVVKNLIEEDSIFPSFDNIVEKIGKQFDDELDRSFPPFCTIG